MGQGVKLSQDTADRVVAAAHQTEDWQSSGNPPRSRLPKPTTVGLPQTRMAVVVNIGNPDNRWVEAVEPVMLNVDPWDGQWVIPPGEVSRIWCWPPTRAEDFNGFLVEGGPPDHHMLVTDDMDVCPVFRRRGVWLIQPLAMFGPSRPPTGAYTDCWETGSTP